MIRSLFLTFVFDSDQNTTEVPFFFYIGFQTGSEMVRADGVLIGIISGDTGGTFLQCDEVSAQFVLFSPMVKQNAHIAVLHHMVKAAGFDADLYRETPVFQA